MDGRLANPVRSGTKQPQRVLFGSVSSLPLYTFHTQKTVTPDLIWGLAKLEHHSLFQIPAGVYPNESWDWNDIKVSARLVSLCIPGRCAPRLFMHSRSLRSSPLYAFPVAALLASLCIPGRLRSSPLYAFFIYRNTSPYLIRGPNTVGFCYDIKSVWTTGRARGLGHWVNYPSHTPAFLVWVSNP